jgi:hypothetical protein
MSSTVKRILGEVEKEVDSVTITISGEGAGGFRTFMEKIAKICNAGSSREIAIVEPSSQDERDVTWSFDGDGSTRIEVKGSVEESEDPDPDELSAGIKVEMEHTDDTHVAETIARDHLAEDPRYYTKLRASGIKGEDE